MSHGLVLGKFLPPHAGHVYLIEVARRLCDELTIVLATLDREPIAGELRRRWLHELFPDVRIVHLTDELPQQPSEHPDFWALWRAALQAALPGPADLVFASDPYGGPLAEVLGARWIPVDPGREVHPISGTAIRADLLAHWRHLTRPVRRHFVRRVSVFGPESTGKSTLAAELGAHYRTTVVPEYARTYLEALPRATLTPDDLLAIARGQIASEDVLAADADRVLICDTDPVLTSVWHDVLFGREPDILTGHRHYHGTLLLDVDVPWQPDPVRYRPDDRPAFFDSCKRWLHGCHRSFVEIRGDRAQRLATAIAAIDDLLTQPADGPGGASPWWE